MVANWGMLGHEWAVELLRGHLAGSGARNAYLLTGPEGVGRRTLALRFAQALNCTQPAEPGAFCGECRACRLTERGQHPDLSMVEAEEKGGTLKVGQVRELERSLSLAPYEAEHRVALLLRFEEAHPSAANALLKTLEEPPAKVAMLLTAENAELLLPTIVSRCEVLRLRPLPLETVAEGLRERWGLEEEEARLLAHISGGRPGYALRLHERPELLTQRTEWLDDLQRLLTATRRERFDYAEELSEDKDRLRGALQTWLSYWQDVLLRSAEATAPLANIDQGDEIEELARRLNFNATQGAVRALEGTLDLLHTNVNTRLAMEVLLLNLPTL